VRGFRILLAGLALTGLLAGCEQGMESSLPPKARPPDLVKPPEPVAKPSARSEELRTYYARVQADLKAQGLMRQDGGGIDTPYTARQLAENFERIALYDEYARGGGLRAVADAPSHLRRWVVPVRIGVEFGETVPADLREEDRQYVSSYAARLARLTDWARGHAMEFDVSRVGPRYLEVYDRVLSARS